MKYFHLLPFVSQDVSVVVVIRVSAKRLCFQLVFLEKNMSHCSIGVHVTDAYKRKQLPYYPASLGKVLVAGPQKCLLQWITMFISSYHASASLAKA